MKPAYKHSWMTCLVGSLACAVALTPSTCLARRKKHKAPPPQLDLTLVESAPDLINMTTPLEFRYSVSDRPIHFIRESAQVHATSFDLTNFALSMMAEYMPHVGAAFEKAPVLVIPNFDAGTGLAVWGKLK